MYRQAALDDVIAEIDGRDLRIGERWLADFASTDWLGLGLDEEIIDAIPEYLARWGTQAGWPLIAGGHALGARLEAELASLVEAEECLLAPSARHLHQVALPLLAGGGTVFLDARAGGAMRDACAVAQTRGARVRTFRRDDPDTLTALIAGRRRGPGVVCVDGVDGATGSAGGLAQVAAIARAHDLLLYVDDAHGLGVLGERDPREGCPYGVRGNGIVRHAGLDGDGDCVILVASLSGAFASPLAFVACPRRLGRPLRRAAVAAAALEPAAPGIASLAAGLEALRVTELRGDALRVRLHSLTARVIARMRSLGIDVAGDSDFPIVALAAPAASGEPGTAGPLGRLLLERDIHAATAGPAAGAGAARGAKIHLTAANTDAQVEHLEAVLEEVAEAFKLGATPAD